MKKDHKVSSVVLIPVDPLKNDTSKDHFILRPTREEKQSAIQQSNNEKTTAQDTTIKKYHPTEIDKLPRSAIFSQDLECALCSYKSKVRTNLVRHFQFHDQYSEVPTSAPVNPVPCLEKNEKMFDKMTNLAGSSHPIGRMGSTAYKKQDEEELPLFVPETKR